MMADHALLTPEVDTNRSTLVGRLGLYAPSPEVSFEELVTRPTARFIQ
jgi:hypothetical protein